MHRPFRRQRYYIQKETGAEILNQAKSSINALNVETRLLEAEAGYGLNGITEAIAAATAAWNADLLVVGTSNRRGLERFIVGSVAEQLIAKSILRYYWFVHQKHKE